MGFPGGSMVRNLLTTSGDMGLVPRPGGSHMLQGNWTVGHNYWVHALEPVPPSKTGHWNEKPGATTREWPPLATTCPAKKKKICPAKKTQNSQNK